jgi:hypothetical protein
MNRFLRAIAYFSAVTLLAAGVANAQSALSSLTGTITDSAGSAVPGAKVTVMETLTGVEHAGETNGAGIYSFTDLLPGTYVVKVAKSGFKDVQSDGIIVIAAQRVRFDATLQIGSASETVRVDSTPPTLNTEDAEVGTLITGQDALRQPLARSTLALLTLSPTSVSGNSSAIMIGGQRSNYENLTIDGITTTNNIYGGQSGGMTADQSFESIAEVKVSDSNGSAETPGFASLITTTKGGGNSLHGSAFYTTDNAALNATPFLQLPGTGLKGPELQWYGGSVSGPVWLPKIYNGHDKTFFLFTWEHRTFPLAAGNAQTFNTNLPTLNFQKGDFSSLLNPIYAPSGTPIQLMNPYTGKPFPNNVIDPSLFSSVALALQKSYMPAPNAGDPNSYIDNYIALGTSPEHINRFDIRIDHHINEKDIITARFTRQTDPSPTHYDNGTLLLGHAKIATFDNAFLSQAYSFTPNLANELRVGYSFDERNYKSFHDGNEVIQTIGLKGIGAAPGTGGFPEFDFGSGINGFYENPSQIAISKSLSVLDNVTWQHGRHTMKAGTLVAFARPEVSDGAGVNQFGEFGFNGFATGFDYADFLLGIPSTQSLSSNPPDRYNRHVDTSLFVQDSWKVTNTLTLTLGLRWEYFQPPVDANDRRANFDPATGAAVLPDKQAAQYLSANLPTALPIEISPNGFPGRSMLFGNKGNFGPRVGVAYLLDPNTVIRGGWGIYYGQLVNAVQDSLAGGGVFGTQINATNTLDGNLPTFQFPDPFAGITAEGTACTSQCLGLTGTDPHIKTPNSQQWNLTIERDLGHSTVASIAYRGFIVRNLPYTIDLTIPPTSTDPSNLTASVYPLLSQASWTRSGAIQRENSFDAGLQRKFTRELTFQLGYTWAKNLSDDNGVGGNQGDGESDSPSNPYDLKADYGNIFYVPRHRFVGSTVWDLPFGRGKAFGSQIPKPVDYIIGGWETSGIFVAQTGNFLTPTYDGILADGSQQNIRLNQGISLRPNCVGNYQVENPNTTRWFNPAAFAKPSLGQYGNCGVGIFEGPGLWSVNLGFHKSIPITEKVFVRFEANMMNAFNHPNPGNPDTDLDSSGVGQITTTNAGINALNPQVTTAAGERHIWGGVRVQF